MIKYQAIHVNINNAKTYIIISYPTKKTD